MDAWSGRNTERALSVVSQKRLNNRSCPCHSRASGNPPGLPPLAGGSQREGETSPSPQPSPIEGRGHCRYPLLDSHVRGNDNGCWRAQRTLPLQRAGFLNKVGHQNPHSNTYEDQAPDCRGPSAKPRPDSSARVETCTCNQEGNAPNYQGSNHYP